MLTSSRRAPALLLLVVLCNLASILALFSGNLGDIKCSAQLKAGGCAGADLSETVELSEPFEDAPAFCAPDCLSDAGSRDCVGTQLGDTITTGCGLLNCLKPVFQACKTAPCSKECGEVLVGAECLPLSAELDQRGLSGSYIGPSSPQCLSNSCATLINTACGTGSEESSKVCTTECVEAIQSVECLAAGPGTIPLQLQQVAGPDSAPCILERCNSTLQKACGAWSNGKGFVDEAMYCSQACADAFLRPMCSGTTFEEAAGGYGPNGFRCAASTCVQELASACGNVEQLDFSVASTGSLPQACAPACKAALDTQACATADTSALEPLLGPQTPACNKAQCLLGMAQSCEIDLKDSMEEMLRENVKTKMCSSSCRAASLSSACQDNGLAEMHESFCSCAPLVEEACGLDVDAPAKPWNEMVLEGNFCSEECGALLEEGQAGAGGSCLDLLPTTIKEIYNFTCSCGESLSSSCRTVTGPGPFTDECCSRAVAPECSLGVLEAMFTGHGSSVSAAALRANMEAAPDKGELGVLYKDVQNIFQVCTGALDIPEEGTRGLGDGNAASASGGSSAAPDGSSSVHRLPAGALLLAVALFIAV
mmetsp:Transcript_39463/g.111824  ORF Transcript_39463/g.111824 Transcript_39463/m.111824 type:complete len:595 (+) Transcript_39463:242-2026(+)